MNYKRLLNVVLLLGLLVLAACERWPGRQPVKDREPEIPQSGSEKSVASDPNANYEEMSSGDKKDMDFNNSAREMHYTATESNGVTVHSFGQYAGEGSGITLAEVAAIPTHQTCKGITTWDPVVEFELDDIFCFQTWDGNFGYIHVVKLKTEQLGSAAPKYTVGIDWILWGP